MAALFVLLSDTVAAFVWPVWIVKALGWPYIQILIAGKEGVVMFFVLSGYVLSRPFVQPVPAGGVARKMSVPAFYVRRFTRI